MSEETVKKPRKKKVQEEPIIEEQPVIVEETAVEEPVIEEPEPIIEEKPLPAEPVVVHNVSVMAEDAPMEQRIMNYLENRGMSGEVKINDFLKSLFPLPKFGEPPIWQKQTSSKLLRNTLDNMSKTGLIEVVNNTHLRLGTFHYPDSKTFKTEYHTIATIPIVVKKVN